MRISDWSADVCSSDLLDAAIPSDEWRSIQPDLDVARLEIRTDTEFDIRNLFRSERLELSQATSKRRSVNRSEEHTSELQSLMRNSYAVFCLKKKNNLYYQHHTTLDIYENRKQH